MVSGHVRQVEATRASFCQIQDEAPEKVNVRTWNNNVERDSDTAVIFNIFYVKPEHPPAGARLYSVIENLLCDLNCSANQ